MSLTIEQKAQFERDGFLAIRGLLSPAEIEEIRAVMFTGSAKAAQQGALLCKAKGGELDRYRAERLRMAAKLAALDN